MSKEVKEAKGNNSILEDLISKAQKRKKFTPHFLKKKLTKYLKLAR